MNSRYQELLDAAAEVEAFAATEGNQELAAYAVRLREAAQEWAPRPCGWCGTIIAAPAQYCTQECKRRHLNGGISEADGGCAKCGGLGHIEAFRHIEGGQCFECDGTGRAN